MNKELYTHIVERFDLPRNTNYYAITDDRAQTRDLIIEHYREDNSYSIMNINSNELDCGISVFNDIATYELAEEILQYIRDVEIIFI